MIKKLAWFGVLLIGFVAHADLFTALEDNVGTVVRNGVELVTGCAHLSANLKRCGAPTVDGSKYCEAHKCKLCNGEVWAGRFCRDCEMSGKSVSREKDQIVEPRVRYSSEPKRLVGDSTPSVESAFVPQTKQAPKRQDGFGVRVSQKKQDSEMLQMFERHREKVRAEIKKGDFSIAYAIIADGVRQEYQKYQSDDNLKKWSDLEHEVRIAQAMAACRPFVVSIRESIASNDFETARQHLTKGRGVAPFLWCTERLSWEKLEREIIVAHKSKQRKDAMRSYVTDVRNAVATNGFAEARSRISEGRKMYSEYSTADNSKDEAWDRLEHEVDEKEIVVVLKPMVQAVRNSIAEKDFDKASALITNGQATHPGLSLQEEGETFVTWHVLRQEVDDAVRDAKFCSCVKSVRGAIAKKDFDKAAGIVSAGCRENPDYAMREGARLITWKDLNFEILAAVAQERLLKEERLRIQEDAARTARFKDVIAAAAEDHKGKIDLKRIGVEFPIESFNKFRLGASKEEVFELVSSETYLWGLEKEGKLGSRYTRYKGLVKSPFRGFVNVTLLFDKSVGLIAVYLEAPLPDMENHLKRREFEEAKGQIEEKFGITLNESKGASPGDEDKVKHSKDVGRVIDDVGKTFWEINLFLNFGVVSNDKDAVVASWVKPLSTTGIVQILERLPDARDLSGNKHSDWSVERLSIGLTDRNGLFISFYSEFLDGLGRLLEESAKDSSIKNL